MPKAKLVIVVGNGRSGTNLLGHLLGSHPEATADIEREPIFGLVTRAAFYPQERQKLMPLILRHYHERLSGVRGFLVDKSHPALWLMTTIAARFPDTLFVRARRKLEGAVASGLRHKGTLDWYSRRPPAPCPPLGITSQNERVFWRLPIVAKLARRWEAHEGVRYAEHASIVDVHYEELTADPERALVGLPAELRDGLDLSIVRPPSGFVLSEAELHMAHRAARARTVSELASIL